ncbi:unnamed protein product, partial [Mesorhabditis spiculigera]
MFKILSFIQKLLNDPQRRPFLNTVDRLFAYWMPCLIPSAVTVLGLLFFAKRISCWTSAHYVSGWLQYVEVSCYMENSYHSPAKFGGWCQGKPPSTVFLMAIPASSNGDFFFHVHALAASLFDVPAIIRDKVDRPLTIGRQFGLTVVYFERVYLLHGHGLLRERYHDEA